jgi:hypothetical protein
MNELQKIFEDSQPPSCVEEGLMKYWNSQMQNVKVPKHKSVESSVLRDRNKLTGEQFSKTLRTIIAEAIMLGWTPDKLKPAIDNYRKVMSSSDYFYNIKFNLGEFIYRGLYGKSGFKQFLPSNNPLLKFKRKTIPSKNDEDYFSPITEKFDKSMTYDPVRKTFYGFKIDKIKNYKERRKDLDEFLVKNDNKLDFTYFCELELVLAAFIFHRKTENDLVALYTYMKLWKENKELFREQAKRKVEW